ncbi:MAG: Ig-like domain-containing protein [Acidobacteria bacterium]|nr:Ig-like domain-containing protein [Acidobacteriota bacterium]
MRDTIRRFQGNQPAAAQWVLAAAATLLGPIPAAAQLNQNCTVSVLNRNTQVAADGSWLLPNIPAGFGRVRARASCVNNGTTTFGQSDYFVVPVNGGINIPPIRLGNTTPVPVSLTVTAPNTTVTSLGGTVQLTVLGTYPSGPPQNITASSTGTSYTSTNPAIATVSSEGLVTAVTTGTVVIQAANEGASGMIAIRVLPSGNLDSDNDGIPDQWELDHGLNPHDPSDALLDPDQDGLTNLREYQIGTDINNPDTDGDGLLDGEEVNATGHNCTVGAHPVCYHTNPLLADTDGDGVNDYTEIRTGSDPTNAASLNLAAAMDRVDVTPATFTLIVNSLNGVASVQLTVTGHLIDNHTINLTSTTRGTQYSSDNLASCNFGSPDGRVYASSIGSCNITVRTNGYTSTVRGNVQNFAPLPLSYVSIPGFANGVAVAGDYAYVAAGSAGLQVVSLSSNRLTPTLVGSLAMNDGTAWHVTVSGSRAYVSGTFGFRAVDITDPTHPVLLGTYSALGTARGARIRGQVAYVAAGSGITMVNVSNPSTMLSPGSLNIGGTCYNLDVTADARLAAVACGSSGVRLVDVSNPAAPVGKGSINTGDARAAAFASASLMVVGDYSNGMTSVNISDVNAPTIVTSLGISLGGRDTDVAIAGSFAMASEVYFVNGVPIADISDPTAFPARAILNFCTPGQANCPQYSPSLNGGRDDNGMGIAVDSAFIYLVTDHSNLDRGGSSGDSRLYIGQYQPRQDLAGVPPTISISSPANNTTEYQGASLTITANATDDVAVAYVDFLVNGQVAYTTSTEPFEYTFQVPAGGNQIVIGARATDLGNNVGTAQSITLPVVPDPLTVVSGLVVDPAHNPVAAATVITNGGRTGVTGADGRFTIVGVPTVQGNIVASARFTDASNTQLTGSSAPFAPVRGGTTDVGTISLASAQFEANIGNDVINCDDCNYTLTLPFPFPYYGTNQTQLYIGSNGYLTFGHGDNTYTESLAAFQNTPRISLFFDDLDERCHGGVYLNTQLPGKVVITYDHVDHYSCYNGPNTMQIQLYPDGRIVFIYNGITSTTTGMIVGINPGPNTPSQAIDYRTQTNVNVAAGTAIYEYFTNGTPFNIDYSSIVFTPQPGGGYNVLTLLQPNQPANNVVAGSNSAAQAGNAQAAQAMRNAIRQSVLRASDLANAEVIVRSSGNPDWVGMTNTDANGNFLLTGVPAGGINVTVRRRGAVVAQGSGLIQGGSIGAQQILQVGLQAPVIPPPK